jgi:Flp pilus assembly pilin Flp
MSDCRGRFQVAIRAGSLKSQQNRGVGVWPADCIFGSGASAQTGENMKAMLRKLWLEDEGQDLAEYGLLLILIAVAVVTGITLFKDQIVNAFASATSVLSGS